MESKIVQRFGNSGHVVLPKEYVGKRIAFLGQPKIFGDIKREVLEMLAPCSEHILGVYLYGSYARQEEAAESDVDILVVADRKLQLEKKILAYSIAVVTLNEMDTLLRENAVLLLPIIKEAKAVINPMLLEGYKEKTFTFRNTHTFLENTTKILGLNRKGLDMDFEIGSLVYSLMLRIRGLLMIELIRNGGSYSKSALFEFLRSNGISAAKIKEFYTIYGNEREGERVTESSVIGKMDIVLLLRTAEQLLGKIGAGIR